MENENVQTSVQPSNTPSMNYTYVPTVNKTLSENASKKSLLAIGALSCGILFLISMVISCGFTLSLFRNSFQLDNSQSISSNYSDITLTERIVATINKSNRSSFDNKIAVINIEGVIYYTPSPNIEVTNNYTIGAQLQKALDDSSVKAIVLRFNTPGGDVLAAEPLCRQIKSIDQQKPVIAFIDSMGASLGYLLANCTRTIYARPDTITGSIGVVYENIDLTGILTNLGAEHTVITNSKGSQKALRDLDDPESESYQIVQSMLDETYEYFVQTVLDGRKRAGSKITEQDLRRHADGRIFTGRQAERIGLVDNLGEYEEVLYEITDEFVGRSETTTVVEYDIEMDIFKLLFSRSSKLFVGAKDFLTNPRQSKLMFIMHE